MSKETLRREVTNLLAAANVDSDGFVTRAAFLKYYEIMVRSIMKYNKKAHSTNYIRNHLRNRNGGGGGSGSDAGSEPAVLSPAREQATRWLAALQEASPDGANEDLSELAGFLSHFQHPPEPDPQAPAEALQEDYKLVSAEEESRGLAVFEAMDVEESGAVAIEDLNNVSKYFNIGASGPTVSSNWDRLFQATEGLETANMAQWCSYLEAKKGDLGEEDFASFLSYVEQTSRYFAMESPQIKELATPEKPMGSHLDVDPLHHTAGHAWVSHSHPERAGEMAVPDTVYGPSARRNSNGRVDGTSRAEMKQRGASRAGPGFSGQAQRILNSPPPSVGATRPTGVDYKSFEARAAEALSVDGEDVGSKLQRMRTRATPRGSPVAAATRRKTMAMSAQDDAFLARAEATLSPAAKESPLKRSQRKEPNSTYAAQAEEMLQRGGN